MIKNEGDPHIVYRGLNSNPMKIISVESDDKNNTITVQVDKDTKAENLDALGFSEII